MKVIIILIAVAAGFVMVLSSFSDKEGVFSDDNNVSDQNIVKDNSENIDANINSSDKNKDIKEEVAVEVEEKNEDREQSKTIYIKVPKLDYVNNKSYIIFDKVEIPYTKAVLDAVYKQLFPNRNTELVYDRVEIVDGVVKVYFNGVVSSGHMSNLNFGATVESASLQFSSVDNIEVYVNNDIFDWCSIDESDGENGCPDKKRLWDKQMFQRYYSI